MRAGVLWDDWGVTHHGTAGPRSSHRHRGVGLARSAIVSRPPPRRRPPPGSRESCGPASRPWQRGLVELAEQLAHGVSTFRRVEEGNQVSERAIAYVQSRRLADPDAARVFQLLAERTPASSLGDELAPMGLLLAGQSTAIRKKRKLFVRAGSCSYDPGGVPARPGAGAFKCDVGSCLAFLDEGRPAARYTHEVSDGDGVVYLAPESDRNAARFFSSAAS